jgi:hypothetical protein
MLYQGWEKLTFYSKGSLAASTVKWTSHQTLLENSKSDVLLLLDCCQATGGGGNIEPGTSKEIIAACGFGSAAPGVGQHSFSRALIEELTASHARPFSTEVLHLGILTRLRGRVPVQAEERETPVRVLMGPGGLQQSQITIVSYEVWPRNLIA